MSRVFSERSAPTGVEGMEDAIRRDGVETQAESEKERALCGARARAQPPFLACLPVYAHCEQSGYGIYFSMSITEAKRVYQTQKNK